MSSNSSVDRECGYANEIADRMIMIQTQINFFKTDGLFCDVQLSFGTIKIQANRLMLATVKYFYASFTCRMREDQSDVVDMTLSVSQELANPLLD